MTPDATASPLLEAEGVVAGYLPGVDILRGCDLSVGPGELVGVIGPNGAGKSTLVTALVGVVTTSPVTRRTSSWNAGLATCRRSTTCSQCCP